MLSAIMRLQQSSSCIQLLTHLNSIGYKTSQVIISNLVIIGLMAFLSINMYSGMLCILVIVSLVRSMGLVISPCMQHLFYCTATPRLVIMDQSSPLPQLLLGEDKGCRYSPDSQQYFLLRHMKRSALRKKEQASQIRVWLPSLYAVICVPWAISSIPMALIIIYLYVNDYKRKFKSLASPFLLNYGFTFPSVYTFT